MNRISPKSLSSELSLETMQMKDGSDFDYE